MRIVIIGQSAFGESVLKSLVDREENVIGVFCPPDAGDKRQDPIKALAISTGTPVYQFARMRNEDCISTFKSLSADLAIMAYVIDIVPNEILEAPTKGTIQYHPSLLPKHRGPSSINWAIINGEKKTGLTVFWPDGDLDTGPILSQKSVNIEPEDSTGSLYFNKLFPEGVSAIIDALDKVRDGTAPRITQDHSKATYEGWCKAKDVIVNWYNSIDSIHDLIRGSDPSPGARTFFNGLELCLYNASKLDNTSDAEPGQIIWIDEDGLLISGNGGAIRVKRIRSVGNNKLNASEWAKTVSLKPGNKFENKII